MKQPSIIISKKMLIITVIIVIMLFFTWAIFSIIDNSNLRIKKIYDVRSDFSFLVVCFNKEVQKDNANLSIENFGVKNRVAQDSSCLSFQLSNENRVFLEGDYKALLSAESDSGHKIKDQEINFKIVNEANDNTLSNNDIARIVDANNDSDIEEWMKYWEQQPIYKHVDPNNFTREGALWSVALRVNNDNEPIIIIYLNMPEPPKDRPILINSVEQYKKAALEEIKGWDVNIDDYDIEYRFNG